jgi:hypothetical protein
VYERRNHPLLPRRRFVKRVALHISASIGLAAIALGLGMAGYRYLGGLSWIDAFLNASMILGGMGPIDTLHTFAAKTFAGLYALFSGLVFIGITGVITAPFIHRLLHYFHVEGSKTK